MSDFRSFPRRGKSLIATLSPGGGVLGRIGLFLEMGIFAATVIAILSWVRRRVGDDIAPVLNRRDGDAHEIHR
jgi:hypothetical protein